MLHARSSFIFTLARFRLHGWLFIDCRQSGAIQAAGLGNIHKLAGVNAKLCE